MSNASVAFSIRTNTVCDVTKRFIEFVIVVLRIINLASVKVINTDTPFYYPNFDIKARPNYNIEKYF